MTKEIALVYTTVSSKRFGRKLASELIKRKLAACVNIFAINSVYRWKGKIERAKEYALLIKTVKRKAKDVTKFLRENHEYELPCVISLHAKASEDFASWVESECNVVKNRQKWS